MVKIAIVFLLALGSAIFYRIGGKGGFPKAKLIRRLGVPLLCYYPALLFLFGDEGRFWGFLSAGLLSFALSTYHDYLAPNRASENWFCWLVTGLCYGLAALPILWCGITFYSIIGRSITLAVFTMLASERTGKDWLEEGLRGFLIVATLPILFL